MRGCRMRGGGDLEGTRADAVMDAPMRRILTPAALVVAFALGCIATSAVLPTSHASPDGTRCDAWRIGGLSAFSGGSSGSSSPVNEVPEDAEFRSEPAPGASTRHGVTIPSGWTPVGATAWESVPIVVACRSE